MLLTLYIKWQYNMWCLLAMAFNAFHTRQTMVPAFEFYSQMYIHVKISKVFRGKPTRLSKFWKRGPLRTLRPKDWGLFWMRKDFTMMHKYVKFFIQRTID